MNARKDAVAAADVPALLASARSVIVARGKKWTEFDVAQGGVTAELESQAVGRSGKLRAPTLRIGDDWLVGFGEPAWTNYFGA